MMRTVMMLLLQLALVSVAWSGQTAGWIDSFEGDAEHYQILRDDKNVTVEIYTQLENGDVIKINDVANTMGISLADGTVVELNAANTPYVVECSSETSSVLSNMLAWAQTSLNMWSDDQEQAQRRMTMRTRRASDLSNQPALKAPLYSEHGKVLLLEGDRPLYIAWKDGLSPYKVNLVQRGENPRTVFQVNEIEGERLQTGPLHFTAGMDLLLEISDARETLQIPLDIKSSADFPKVDPEISDWKNDSSAMVTLYASWLAGKHPEWSFEAYQLVSGVADQYVPAALLHDALERGMRPE